MAGSTTTSGVFQHLRYRVKHPLLPKHRAPRCLECGMRWSDVDPEPIEYRDGREAEFICERCAINIGYGTTLVHFHEWAEMWASRGGDEITTDDFGRFREDFERLRAERTG